jgi:hypothetical protein
MADIKRATETRRWERLFLPGAHEVVSSFFLHLSPGLRCASCAFRVCGMATTTTTAPARTVAACGALSFRSRSSFDLRHPCSGDRQRLRPEVVKALSGALPAARERDTQCPELLRQPIPHRRRGKSSERACSAIRGFSSSATAERQAGQLLCRRVTPGSVH